MLRLYPKALCPQAVKRQVYRCTRLFRHLRPRLRLKSSPHPLNALFWVWKMKNFLWEALFLPGQG